MFAEERYRRIMDLLRQNGRVTVAELSESLQVSPVTIRRDLEKLEEREWLLRTHGGAVLPPEGGSDEFREKSVLEKQEQFVEEKRRIARAAAELVHNGETVALTPGSTNLFLAECLGGKKDVTLVTNALNIALAAARFPELDVVVVGGKLRRKSLAVTGPIAEADLRELRVDKLFLGVDGLDPDAGLTTPNLSEAGVNRCMIDIAREVVVVADRSKFGKVTLSCIAPVERADLIISDRGLSQEMARRIEEKGVRLVLV